MAGRTATITVLFTDVVGSTARLAALGEMQGRAVFDAHHRLLSTAVAAHGGEEAKWLGDGVMAVFGSAADAVRCATDVQRRAAVVPVSRRLEVRVGLALGEATKDGDDWFGTPVVTASRLCAAAGPGEILCPELVVTLLSGFDDLTFDERGPLEARTRIALAHALARRGDRVEARRVLDAARRAADAMGAAGIAAAAHLDE